MQSRIDAGLVSGRVMVGHQLGANDLESQRDCRHQHQQSGDRGSMAVSCGAEQARHRDVVFATAESSLLRLERCRMQIQETSCLHLLS